MTKTAPVHDDDWIFAQPEGSEVSMFIQWKGTDVCIDWTCPHCGADHHYDGGYAYYLGCRSCSHVYRMGTQVIAKAVDMLDHPNCVVQWSDEVDDV